MSETHNQTLPEDWAEWKRICNLAGCSEEARLRLAAFARMRWASALRPYQRCFKIPGDIKEKIGCGESDPGAAWHELEVYCQINSTTEGKRYKDLLIEKAALAPDDPAGILQRMATCYFKTIVRQTLESQTDLFAHFQGHALNSIEEIFAGDPDATGGRDPLGRLLIDPALSPFPQPDSHLERRELARFAASHGLRLFNEMGEFERITWLARALDLPFSGEVVGAAAGLKHAQLSAKAKQCLEALEAEVGRIHESEFGAPETPDELIDLIVLALCHLATEWGKSETRMAPLFQEHERRSHEQ